MEWLSKPIVWITVGAVVIGLSVLKNVPFASIVAWLKNLLPKPGPKPEPEPVSAENATITAVRNFMAMKAASAKDDKTKAAMTQIWAGMEPQ